jgi:hypothetical protein
MLSQFARNVEAVKDVDRGPSEPRSIPLEMFDRVFVGRHLSGV